MELSPFFGPTIYLNGALEQTPDATIIQKARANSIDFSFIYILKYRYNFGGISRDFRGSRDMAVGDV